MAVHCRYAEITQAPPIAYCNIHYFRKTKAANEMYMYLYFYTNATHATSVILRAALICCFLLKA